MSKALNDAHDATTIGTGRNLGPGLSFRIHRRRLAVVWGCPLMIEKFAATGELGSVGREIVEPFPIGPFVTGANRHLGQAAEDVEQHEGQFIDPAES